MSTPHLSDWLDASRLRDLLANDEAIRTAERIREVALCDEWCQCVMVLNATQYERYVGPAEFLSSMPDDTLRTFLLFVACALEG